MHDEEIREILLVGMEEEDPSPGFSASMRTQLGGDEPGTPEADERLDDGGGDDAPVVEITPWAADSHRWARRWIQGGVAVAAVALVVVGIVMARSREDSGVVAGPGPAVEGYDASVLPEAVVRDGDPDVTGVAASVPQGLAEVWSEEYADESAGYADAGYIDGLVVEFESDWPQTARPVPGFSAAHRFGDAEGASRALAVTDRWHRDKAHVTFRQGQGEDLTEFDVDVGDEAIGFVQGHMVGSPTRSQGVVILWRTDNIVHTLRVKQDFGAPGGVEGVIELARAVDARMSAA